jgi:hypothetical protein
MVAFGVTVTMRGRLAVGRVAGCNSMEVCIRSCNPSQAGGSSNQKEKANCYKARKEALLMSLSNTPAASPCAASAACVSAGAVAGVVVR